MRRLRGPLLGDLLSLYGLQIGNILIPLLTFPVLARSLSPVNWASLLVAQALGVAVATVVDYGHTVTATRRIASGEPPRRTAELVYATKGLLALLCVLTAVVAWWAGWTGGYGATLLLGGLVYGLLQGSLPSWYFQGQNRARVAANVDMGFKLAAGLAMVSAALLWRDPAAVMWSQALGVALTWGLLTARLGRELPPGRARLSLIDVWRDLREGSAVFLFRLLGSSYTSALALLLAATVSPLSSALLLAADRIAKVAPTFTVPLCQALYPRVVQSGAHATPRGRRQLLGLAGSVLAGLLLASLLLFWWRDPLVTLLLGETYAPAADVLVWTLWLMPFIGWNTVLLQLWIFPQRRDGLANALLLLNALISVGWVLGMAGRVPLPVYAAGISAAEVLVAGLLLLLLLGTRDGPHGEVARA
ncbi:lipopolysaccharide biosynthesis protein [Deinococcus sp. MIMF12]|uniref:Lipopolysaccharide biosynthesis protein n=1 Tax=Deinococcus rhizophilus TaxID=3049544 RepID=A0ABT7JEY6_9DEIO|nr:lipopolysaccharide biosynthesis protein [Deinococcus rhizophilus]MDL2343606.1 lipopolysaccharide biosynthesis protein [Deinococcus rhizophilus]